MQVVATQGQSAFTLVYVDGTKDGYNTSNRFNC